MVAPATELALLERGDTPNHAGRVDWSTVNACEPLATLMAAVEETGTVAAPFIV
jgi:hypothetical protein